VFCTYDKVRRDPNKVCLRSPAPPTVALGLFQIGRGEGLGKGVLLSKRVEADDGYLIRLQLIRFNE
jgi:hypothetical protein